MTVAPRYTLRWSEQAARNVDDAAEGIARHDPNAARNWIERLIECVENTTTIPLAGRVVPELGRPDLRETFLDRYRIVYRIAGSEVTVVAVFRGERDGPPAAIEPDAD